jgi:hypothetical protein
MAHEGGGGKLLRQIKKTCGCRNTALYLYSWPLYSLMVRYPTLPVYENK